MAMYNEITVTAELTNTEYMITKNYNLLENKPQINSVELTGNKSLEDLGINPDAEPNVIDTVKVNGSALTPDENKAVNVTVTTGSDNGTVKVNGSDVAVKGLKSAAFTEATAYDAAGSAVEVQGNVDALTVVVNGKVDKVQGKGLSQNDFTNAYKSKLDGIEAGAQVNTVTSVAGKTGAVTLQKSDVGLGNVDNTSDLNKPISTATQTALNGKVDKETGKGLSTNDYTTAEKNKLAGIAEGATAVSISDTLAEGDTLANITINGTTTTIKGGSGSGAVDDELSPTSINPVQNKVIYETLNNLLPEATASGNPISIDNASGFNAKSAKATMLPIQDLHGQEAPYPAGGGKNKYNGYFVNSGFSESDTKSSSFPYCGNNAMPIIAGNAYTVSVNGTDRAIRYGFLDSEYNLIGPLANSSRTTTVAPENAAYLRWRFSLEATEAEEAKAQIEIGSTATSYAPYSNICPISGRDSVDLNVGGINQWDEEWEVGGLDDVTGQTLPSTNTIRSKNYITVNAETAYYAYVGSNKNIRVLFYDSNKDCLSYLESVQNATFTTPSNTAYIKFRTYAAYGTTYLDDIAINYPSTDSSYHQYITPTTYTATFPSTVYGGEYEFVNGPLTENMDIVDLGSLTWIYNTSFTNPIFYAPLPSKVNDRANTGICSCYPVNPVNATGAQNAATILNDNEIAISINTGSYHLFIRDESFTSADSLKEFLSGKQLCYELATPTTTTLTQQSISLNKGVNVITTDGDNAGVKYSVSLDSLLPT